MTKEESPKPNQFRDSSPAQNDKLTQISYLTSHIFTKTEFVDIFFQFVEYAIFAVTKNLSLFLINKYNVKHEEH